VGIIRKECLNKLILFGESGVRHAISQFVEYYHRERVHCALGRRIENQPQSQAANIETSPTDSATSPTAATVPDVAVVPAGAAPESRSDSPATIDEVRCRERLGGLLKSYYRQAA